MSRLTIINSKHCCCTTVTVALLSFGFRLDIGDSSLQNVVAPVLHCGTDGERERENLRRIVPQS